MTVIHHRKKEKDMVWPRGTLLQEPDIIFKSLSPLSLHHWWPSLRLWHNHSNIIRFSTNLRNCDIDDRAGNKLIIDGLSFQTAEVFLARHWTLIAPNGDRQHLAWQLPPIVVWMYGWMGEWNAAVLLWVMVLESVVHLSCWKKPALYRPTLWLWY